MEEKSRSQTPVAQAPAATAAEATTPWPAESTGANKNTPAVDKQLNSLSVLLEHLEPEAPKDSGPAQTPESEYENHLAQVRLGLANSLFAALRCKHGATASHSVRVALGCSAWALAMQLPDDERDALEIAALLHDVGKIGVPDRLLLKPAALAAEEHELMDRHRQMGLGILENCCASPQVLEIVRHAPTWFDGSRLRVDLDGPHLPLGARMLAIVDAFDSMTTPQVYRPALSRERAIKELCDFAGTQFDPQLVLHFASLHATDQQKLHRRVARRWLQELDADSANAWWHLQERGAPAPNASPEAYFPQTLLENMYDGVIFLDANLQVTLWNRGAERLTGITGNSMLQRPFVPSLLELRDDTGRPFGDHECPVAFAVHSGVQSLRRMILRDREGRELSINMHIIPVVGPAGGVHGATMLLHDASGQASLEERCQNLYEQATRDPLTQLANRAEFDRVHTLFVNVHMERSLTCSLIMCDLDHFKQVNDTFGHQAGDEIIKSFAQLLKSSCRPGDLVARYGGEEFVILCADCDNAAAAARAEQVRLNFARLTQPALEGKNCTVSFGVTEIQPGDSPQTMLNRADRALLLAKQGGRNVVVQLGSGMNEDAAETHRGWWFWQKGPVDLLLERHLVTNVPVNIAVEKLRGFVADHQAEITSIRGDRVELYIPGGKLGLLRRQSDRSVPLVMELEFAEEKTATHNSLGAETGERVMTRIN